MSKLTSKVLHEELAAYYSSFPGVTVTNSHTEAMWRKIEELEAKERG